MRWIKDETTQGYFDINVVQRNDKTLEDIQLKKEQVFGEEYDYDKAIDLLSRYMQDYAGNENKVVGYINYYGEGMKGKYWTRIYYCDNKGVSEYYAGGSRTYYDSNSRIDLKHNNMKRIKDYADYEGQDLDYNQIYEEATDELINMKRSGRTYGGWRSVAYYMGFNLDSLNGDDLETLKDAIEDAMMDNEDLFVPEPWKHNGLSVSDSRRVKDEQRDVSYGELEALQQDFETQLDEANVIFDDDDDYNEALNDFIQQYIEGDDNPQIDFSIAKARPVRDSKRRYRADDSRINHPITSKRVSDSIKSKVSIHKKVTDALAKFFQKDLKNLQAYRRVTDSEGKIKENVVFLIEDSDVLAVFPNTYGTASRDKDTMACYSHNGQHGICTYDYANTLKTADSYNELKDELTNYVGYNLNIIDSLPAETELQQNAKEIKDAYIKHKRQAIADERMLARGEEIEYKGKRGTVQYALFHGQEPVIIRWQNEEGSEEFEIPYNEVRNLKIHDSEDIDTDDVNVETTDTDVDDVEVTDNCGKGKKKAKDSVKKVKVFKRNKKA